MNVVKVEGVIRVPGDKSLSHRALMFGAVATGENRLRGLLPGADCRSTAAILRAMGNPIPELPADGGEIRWISPGIEAWREPADLLDCGNSGTTARLIMGLLASRPFAATLSGDESLRSRPMRRITDPLSRMGASFRELDEPDRLPIEVRGGPLSGIEYRSPKASAQIKSAVLLAGFSAGVPVSVLEPERSRDHSERMLASLGCRIDEQAVDDGWKVALEPPEGPVPALDMDVPGDPSSAAFPLALGLLADSGSLLIRDVGLNPTRTGFIDAVQRMGGKVELQNQRSSGGEPVGDIVVYPSTLRAIDVSGPEIPAMIDEIPMLACLAARADGETRIVEAEELRAKESDRITAIVSNLQAIGVDARELDDGLVVHGSDHPLRGRVRALHDHRIAMAFGILGTLPGNDISIDTPEVVDVSFPGYWDLLDQLSGQGAAR